MLICAAVLSDCQVAELHKHQTCPPPSSADMPATTSVWSLPVDESTGGRLTRLDLTQAAMLALFPLVFFFQFLYYTDLPCIVFVLATHLVGKSRL